MFDALLRANRHYVSSFALEGMPGSAAKGFALVTCMDSRIEPLAILGIGPGDAKIMRNAGGRVTTDVLRSLILATQSLGVSEVAVMHHTRCALAYRTDEEVKSELPIGTAADRSWEFLAMPDPDDALRADVEAVRTCELMASGVRVEGWRYSVETGSVLRVVAA